MTRATTYGVVLLLLLSCSIVLLNEDLDGSRSAENTQPVGGARGASRGPKIPHGIIRINSNMEFAAVASSESWQGSGLPGNPFIIENYDINAQGSGSCIYIGNTTAHFIIRNCNLTNGSHGILWEGSGITLYNTANGMLVANNCSNNKNGIFLYGFSTINNLIENNSCTLNNFSGISLDSCDYNTIRNNTCELNNHSGIALTSCQNNIFEFNKCNYNVSSYGIYLFVTAKKNTIRHNTCNFNNGTGIFLENGCSDNTIQNNICWSNVLEGIMLSTNCNNNDLTFNNCSGNTHGIFIHSSTGNDIVENNCSKNENGFGIIMTANSNTLLNNTCSNNNKSGVLLSLSDSCIISNNECNYNNDSGIYLYTSKDNIIKYNNFLNNDNGTSLYQNSDSNWIYENIISYNSNLGFSIDTNSDTNKIFHNNIISNNDQASDASSGSNDWDDGDGEGNYWSDYTGLDNGAGGREAGDGIGDTLLPHPGAGFDFYPFMNSNGWFTLPTPLLYDPGVLNTTGDYIVVWNSSSRADKYILEEDTALSFSTPSEIYNGSGLSFGFVGKGNGTYFYRLRIFNEYTKSSWSKIEDITVDWSPIAPSGLNTKDVTGKNITLTWDFNIESDIKGYHILINDTGAGVSGPFHWLQSVNSSINEYKITGLSEETTYYFVVVAFDNRLTNSTYSNVASATTGDVTAPKAPTGLNATAISDTQIYLSWDANSEPDLMGYNIYMSASADPLAKTYINIHTIEGARTTHTVTKLEEKTTYHFKVTAYDEVPWESVASEIVSATTLDLTPPSAPTGLVVTNPTNDSLTLSWFANPEFDVIGYMVYRSKSPTGGFVNLTELTKLVNGTKYIDTGLEEGTNYHYKITAVDDVKHESEYSIVASGKTLDVNFPPEINIALEDFSIVEDSYNDSAINLFTWFIDFDQDILTFRVEGAKHIKVTIYDSNGTVILEPVSNWNGQETLTFFANDSLEEIFDILKITVTAVNDPPGLAQILAPDNGFVIKEGETLTFEGACTDPDLPFGDHLTFRWNSSIQGMLGHGENLSNVKLQVGEHTITLNVTDNTSESSTATIEIIVKKKTTDEKVDDITTLYIMAGSLVIIIIIILVALLILIKKKKVSKADGEKKDVQDDQRKQFNIEWEGDADEGSPEKSMEEQDDEAPHETVIMEPMEEQETPIAESEEESATDTSISGQEQESEPDKTGSEVQLIEEEPEGMVEEMEDLTADVPLDELEPMTEDTLEPLDVVAEEDETEQIAATEEKAD